MHIPFGKEAEKLRKTIRRNLIIPYSFRLQKQTQLFKPLEAVKYESVPSPYSTRIALPKYPFWEGFKVCEGKGKEEDSTPGREVQKG